MKGTRLFGMPWGVLADAAGRVRSNRVEIAQECDMPAVIRVTQV